MWSSKPFTGRFFPERETHADRATGGRALLPAPHTSRERAVGETRPAGQGSLLQGCVVEQLLDQVHVGQQHAAAAVALQAQRIQSVPEGEEKAGCNLFVLADGGPCPGWSKPCSAATGSAPHVGEGDTSLISQRRRPSPSRPLQPPRNLAQILRPSIASPFIRHTCTKSLRLPGTSRDPEVQM